MVLAQVFKARPPFHFLDRLENLSVLVASHIGCESVDELVGQELASMGGTSGDFKSIPPTLLLATYAADSISRIATVTTAPLRELGETNVFRSCLAREELPSSGL